jgi:hypothetical protein
MATGTKRSAKLIFVSSQSLKHYSSDARITAEISAGALGVGFGKATDHLQTVISSARTCGAAGIRGNRSVGNGHGKQWQGTEEELTEWQKRTIQTCETSKFRKQIA